MFKKYRHKESGNQIQFRKVKHVMYKDCIYFDLTKKEWEDQALDGYQERTTGLFVRKKEFEQQYEPVE